MRPQIVSNILIFLIHFMVMGVAYGQQKAPPPPQPERTNTPGLPIDDHIVILVIVGFVLAGYFFYRKKRASL